MADEPDKVIAVCVIDNTAQPDEVYILAALSHVAVSFAEPEHTANADAPGRLLSKANI